MSDSNALGWVFPAAGEDIPPLLSEVDFGPIHFQDSIVIQFTPTSFTGEIRLYCDYEDSAQGNVWTLDNTGSPLTYHFNQTTPNAADPNDYHACHFLFASNSPSTSSGNSKAFQYINNATSKAVTWSASGSGAAATTSTSSSSTTSTTSTTSRSTTSTTSTSTTSSSSFTSTSSTSTSTSTTGTPTTMSTSTSSNTSSATAAAAAANTSSANLQAASQPSGLSGGAIAGIVIGVLVLIALIAGLGFFFGRRARKNTSDGPAPLPPNNNESKSQPLHNAQQMHQNQYMAPPMDQHPSWAGKQQPQQTRMGELQGQAVSELDTSVVHELGADHRNELPS